MRLKEDKGVHQKTLVNYCANCGYSDKIGRTLKQTTEEELAAAAPIKIVGDKENRLNTLPTTKIDCPKCGHDEASWWFLQTRSGDEPPTQFYRCVKCNHTWRSYS